MWAQEYLQLWVSISVFSGKNTLEHFYLPGSCWCFTLHRVGAGANSPFAAQCWKTTGEANIWWFCSMGWKWLKTESKARTEKWCDTGRINLIWNTSKKKWNASLSKSVYISKLTTKRFMISPNECVNVVNFWSRIYQSHPQHLQRAEIPGCLWVSSAQSFAISSKPTHLGQIASYTLL